MTTHRRSSSSTHRFAHGARLLASLSIAGLLGLAGCAASVGTDDGGADGSHPTDASGDACVPGTSTRTVMIRVEHCVFPRRMRPVPIDAGAVADVQPPPDSSSEAPPPDASGGHVPPDASGAPLPPDASSPPPPPLDESRPDATGTPDGSPDDRIPVDPTTCELDCSMLCGFTGLPGAPTGTCTRASSTTGVCTETRTCGR